MMRSIVLHNADGSLTISVPLPKECASWTEEELQMLARYVEIDLTRSLLQRQLLFPSIKERA